MKLRYLSNITTLRLDPDKCDGCQMCLKVCPHEVFRIVDKKAVIVDQDACMECGACALNCEPEALTVNSGVGCAAAVLNGLRRGAEPICDCS